MGRPLRKAFGGVVYHVLNRANQKATMFSSRGDYEAFERGLAEAQTMVDMRVLSYCVMPNHWHLVLWPREDGDLSRFVGWLTLTHAQRYRVSKQTVGCGHLYQGRFKSFPTQHDWHLHRVCRYVEANAVAAGLVQQAEDWRWGSLWQRLHPQACGIRLWDDWPVSRPPTWLELVNSKMDAGHLCKLRCSISRGQPFGDPAWTEKTLRDHDLGSTLRSPGRPRAENGS